MHAIYDLACNMKSNVGQNITRDIPSGQTPPGQTLPPVKTPNSRMLDLVN